MGAKRELFILISPTLSFYVWSLVRWSKVVYTPNARELTPSTPLEFMLLTGYDYYETIEEVEKTNEQRL